MNRIITFFLLASILMGCHDQKHSGISDKTIDVLETLNDERLNSFVDSCENNFQKFSHEQLVTYSDSIINHQIVKHGYNDTLAKKAVEQMLKYAVIINPSDKRPYYSLFYLYYYFQDYDKALEILNNEIAKSPDTLLYLKGLLSWETNNKKYAVTCFKRSLMSITHSIQNAKSDDENDSLRIMHDECTRTYLIYLTENKINALRHIHELKKQYPGRIMIKTLNREIESANSKDDLVDYILGKNKIM